MYTEMQWHCTRRDHSCVFYLQAKVRRLYDIANVLTSLALIKKVHVTEERGRKPAFKWIGPVDFSSIGKEMGSAGDLLRNASKADLFRSPCHIEHYTNDIALGLRITVL